MDPALQSYMRGLSRGDISDDIAYGSTLCRQTLIGDDIFMYGGDIVAFLIRFDGGGIGKTDPQRPVGFTVAELGYAWSEVLGGDIADSRFIDDIP